MTYKILIVDDEPANLRLLERLFRADFQVITATSGEEGLELLKMHDVALILSDQRMPSMTGIEFLKRAAALRNQTIRIILTGYTDVNVLVDIINSGVIYKYIAKPWSNADLQQTVTRAVEHYETSKLQHELTLHKARLETSMNVSRAGFVKLIHGMLDLNDSQAHAHACRTAGYAVAVGTRFQLESDEIEELALAAFLHELGNLTISGEITESAQNFGSLAENTQNLARILTTIPHLTEIASALRYQYEYFDGGGAPEKLHGEQIPLSSRIIAAAAFYDSLTDPRQSQTALPHDEAILRLQAEAGEKFDPSVVEKFAELKSLGLIREAVGGAKGFAIINDAAQIPSFGKLSAAEILRLIKTQPQLALEVLRTANSKINTAPVSILSAAMSSLDNDEISRLIGFEAARQVSKLEQKHTSQAIRCAFAAQFLAAHSEILNPDEAYALGLLFNAGENLLENLFPDEVSALENDDSPVNRYQRQHEIFGTDAIQISRRLLESGGLPARLTSALSNNIEWMRVNRPAAVLMQTALTIALADESEEKHALDSISLDMLEILGLRRAELDEILTRTNFISEGINPVKPEIYGYVT